MPNALPQDTLNQAASIVREGGVIVFPTDTAYGLGGDYANQQVIDRILAIKGRTDRKFTVIASSLEQVQQYFDLAPRARELAQQHWPGPLSIVVSDQFSVRVPDNDIARAIAHAAGIPIIATSANRSGAGETYTLTDAQQALGQDAVDAWIDGGTREKRPPSTIIKVNTNGVHVLRQGPIIV